MLAQRCFALVASAMVVMTFAVGSDTVRAQSQPQEARPQPRVPDGILVTPSRPLPERAMPDGGRAGGTARPEATPEWQPHGGCRYEEQPLELVV